MITVSEVVSKLVKRSPFLEEALADGIINVSSLARQLQPEIEGQLKKPVKIGAIVMSINRLPLDASHRTQKGIQKMMSGIGDIVVRSGLSDFTFQNSETLFEHEKQLLEIVEQEKELICTLSQGVYETTLIVSTVLEGHVKKLFAEERMLKTTSDLSSISMKLPKGNTEISGIYYFILKKIAWEGISIIEVISTTNEFTLVVNDADVNRAFSILMGIKNARG